MLEYMDDEDNAAIRRSWGDEPGSPIRWASNMTMTKRRSTMPETGTINVVSARIEDTTSERSVAGRRRSIACIVVTALAVVASACSSGPTTITKAAFVKQANAVCNSASTQLRKLPTPSASSSTQVAADGKKAIVIMHGMITRLQELGAPPGDQASLTNLYREMNGVVGMIGAFLRAEQSHDRSKAMTLYKQGSALDAKLTKTLTSYGLSACVSAGSNSRSSSPPSSTTGPSGASG
ncbi:MAG: hypothetical protein ACYDGY_07595 [Acidimicrobiales bacterium]